MPRSRSLVLVVLALSLLAIGGWLWSGAAGGGVDVAAGLDAPADGGPGTTLTATAADGGAAIDAAATSDGVARDRVQAPNVTSGPGITGQVVDEGGKPVRNARIVCTAANPVGFDFESGEDFDLEALRERARRMRAETAEASSDDEGRFKVAAPGTGDHVNIRVEAKGYLLLNRSAARPKDADVDLGALTVKTGAIVSGRVLDRNGRPIAGAGVARRNARGNANEGVSFEFFSGIELGESLAGGGPDESKTDAEGRFELAHVQPGAFALRARHDEHPATTLDGLTVEPGGTLVDVVVTLEPGTTIRGKLLGVPKSIANLRVHAAPPSGQQVGPPGLVMMLGDTGEVFGGLGAERSAQVADDGTFVLRGLTLDKTYRVWATQSARSFVDNNTCSERKDVPSGAQDVELRYDPGVTVTFTVIGAKDNAAIERLWVTHRLAGDTGNGIDFGHFMPTNGRARSYPEGKVTLTNLRPKKKQALNLSVEALGFAKFERQGIELPITGNLDLGALRLDPVPVMTVRVLAAHDGAPIAGATVRLEERARTGDKDAMDFATQIAGMNGSRTARTDNDGRASVNAPRANPFALKVTDAAHAPYQSEEMTLGERGAEHEVRLVRGGRVEVTVLDAESKPVANATVECRGKADSGGRAATGADGVARFERLTPGRHEFRLAGRGRNVARLGGDIAVAFESALRAQTNEGWTPIDVLDAGLATLELRQDATANLSGLVRENGIPLAGAQVSFVQGTGEAEAGDQGRQLLEAAMGEAFGGRSPGGRRNRGRTDDAGRYEMADVPVGEHRLRVSHPDRAMPETVRVSLRAGTNVFDVDLVTTILRGTVRDSDGKPVADATITVGTNTSGDASRALEMMAGAMPAQFQGRGGKQVKTDAQGRYEVRGVQDGIDLVVRASAKGFAPGTSKPVRVARGTSAEGVDVQVAAAGGVRVRVPNQNLPFASVQAKCTSAESIAPVTRMLQRGEATLEGLTPGTWRIAILSPGAAAPPEPRTVTVIAGQTVDVTF